MSHTHYELYKTYFANIIGRYYTKKQRRRLLKLFTAEHGTDPFGKEFDLICKTVEAIEKQEIRDSMESKNFRLLCRVAQADDMLQVAASALSACYDERDRARSTSYTSLVAWRSAVYTETPKSRETRLEIAYIEYANGNLDAATMELKALANEGYIPAIEHLSYLLVTEQPSPDAFYYIALLQEIYTKYLAIEFPAWLDVFQARAATWISPDDIEDTLRRAQGKAKQTVGNAVKAMPSIGFLQSV